MQDLYGNTNPEDMRENDIKLIRKSANYIGWTLLLFYLIFTLLTNRMPLQARQLLFYVLWVIITLASARYFMHISVRDLLCNTKGEPSTVLDNLILTGLVASAMTIAGAITVAATCGFISNASVEAATTPDSPLSIFLGVLAGPVVEEVIFRGVIWTRFKSYGIPFAITVSTILFIPMHGQGMPVVILFLGIAAGVLMTLTNNVLYPILLHIIHNSGVLLYDDYTKPLFVNWKYTLVVNILLLLFFIVLCGRRVQLIDKIERLASSVKYLPTSLKADKYLYYAFFNTSGVIIFLLYFGINYLLSFLELFMGI